MYAETAGVDYSQLLSGWRDAFTDAEVKRLDELRLERDRRDYLAAHVLLRLALAQTRRRDARTLEIGERAGWSLSHAQGLVACAVAVDATSGIGIDTEPLSAGQRLREIADVFLTDAERGALPGDPDADAKRMVEIWTAKEAVLKALGQGFSGAEGFGVLSSLESTSFEVLDEWATISVRDARNATAYSVWGRWVGLHAIAVVATEGNEGEPRLTGVSLQQRQPDQPWIP